MVIAPSTSNPIATRNHQNPSRSELGFFEGAKCQPWWLALAAISSGTRAVTASFRGMFLVRFTDAGNFCEHGNAIYACLLGWVWKTQDCDDNGIITTASSCLVVLSLCVFYVSIRSF
ncbi:hypothetical protein GBA52_024347 [Prunus armeniaca]|nr:hypothetical protein GBA52_024347 [Prunus armeniaca]